MFSLFQFQFRRRIDHGGLQILNRPLTLHIETADRIYLISPEFHTDRKFLRQRIKIENPAPPIIRGASLAARMTSISALYSGRNPRRSSELAPSTLRSDTPI